MLRVFHPYCTQAVRFQQLEPLGETVSLEDYRLRHALTRTDESLQALSASAPLIAVWDDHEVANDPWVGGAQDHNPEDGEVRTPHWSPRALSANGDQSDGCSFFGTGRWRRGHPSSNTCIIFGDPSFRAFALAGRLVDSQAARRQGLS